MTRRILLDANLLIAVFDEQATTAPESKQHAKVKMAELLTAENTLLVITPLIRYEVLRGISWQEKPRFQQLQQALNGFTELDITLHISELAANLFRFETWHMQQSTPPTARNIDKRKFDVFHFCTAKYHQLELVSLDGDIEKIKQLYHTYIQETNNKGHVFNM